MSKVVYFLYYLARTLYKIKIPFLPKIIQVLIRIFFGCYIPYTAEIGKDTIFAYGGIGVVIHARSIIGKNCTIGSCVTIGGTNHIYEVPVIGDNVYIGTGAKIIGAVKIGNNAAIAANAVVTKDVPDNTLVAGIPARILKENINIKDYA